ncbi:MAG: xanthine dehydrogenase [Alphaproteobacteria bacterium]|nr:MAG: xanthine dehydrogenase [Alphaproteobacteria bacterium]
MTPEIFQQIMDARAQRKAVALVTALDSGKQRVVARDHAADDILAQVLDEAFRFDRSGVHKIPEGEFFVHIHNPPLRLIIIGAVHIAQALIPIARATGYDIVVIDPRGAFATGARFPDVTLHGEWPDEILPGLGLDQRSAMVALTHDPKIDDPSLQLALKSKIFYIGALGSKKTQASRVQRLSAAGFSKTDIARIHGPIGIDIGAQGAPEIAIAIMAELTRVLRLGS